jgi:hypothetical protein
MAHFAWLDDNNTVYQVSVVDNVNLLDENGNESEAVGIAYLTQVHGAGKTWKQTSYNGNFRSKYAGIGDIYDAVNDVFVAPPVEEDAVE